MRCIENVAKKAESLSNETRALIRQTLETAARANSNPEVRQKAAERLREATPLAIPQ